MLLVVTDNELSLLITRVQLSLFITNTLIFSENNLKLINNLLITYLFWFVINKSLVSFVLV